MKNFFSMRSSIFFTLIGIFVLASNTNACACAACYGDTSGDKMGNAATWGIIAMTIIMFAMLGAVGGFIWHLSYRAKHPLPDYQELLHESETHPDHGAAS